VAERGEQNKQPLTAQQLSQTKMVFDRGKLQLLMPDGKSDEGAIRLDTSKSPRQIQVTRQDGRNRLVVLKGIYELTGDHFKLCIGDREDWPTDFASKPNSTIMLVEFRRESKAAND
jgi:uncharacterized protein (TIGR03067 family)